MRRQIGKFLPIVAIALLVQIFAPIAASWAMSSALDPLASVPICSGMTADEGGAQPQHDGQQPHQQTCCPLCTVAQNTALADEPDIAATIPQRYAIAVAWNDHAFVLKFARYDSVAQARAPPKIS
jgi:hypothetical protein